MSKNLIVAIDGPAGSGKSTTAKLVAQKLGYLYIDTGAMYRAVTFLAIKNDVLSNNDAIVKLANQSDIQLNFNNGQTFVKADGKDITEMIRTAEVNANVSNVSKIEGVRKVLVKKQQQLGKKGGVVMEGRDIGTVVFPDADIKFFLTASIKQRAQRRTKEFQDRGIEIPLEEIEQNLIERDKIDSTREASPLIKSPDAIEVDTSNVTIDEQVNIILLKIKEIAVSRGIELAV